MTDAKPVGSEALPCTCGDAFAANQFWHLPECPRAPLDTVMIDRITDAKPVGTYANAGTEQEALRQRIEALSAHPGGERFLMHPKDYADALAAYKTDAKPVYQHIDIDIDTPGVTR